MCNVREVCERLPGMRLAMTAFAVLGALVSLAGCALSGMGKVPAAHTKAVGWTRDASGGISVSHPADWRVSHFEEVGSFTTGLMFLSNRRVNSPCTSTRTSPGTRAECRGLPRADLTSGDVVIGWFSNGFPVRAGYDLIAHTPGQLTHIDGHQAKIATAPATGPCRTDGGTLLMTATIATGPAADNISMSACLARPSSALRKNVLRSLRSVHI